MLDLDGDSVHKGTCVAGTSPDWLRSLATLKQSTQLKRKLPPSSSSPFSQATQLGLQRIAGFFFRSTVFSVKAWALGAIGLFEVSPAFIKKCNCRLHSWREKLNNATVCRPKNRLKKKIIKRLPNTPGNARFQIHWRIHLYFELFLHAQGNRREN